MFVSRTKEMSGEAGVRYCSLGNCSASTAKMTPTSVCPMSFSLDRRPRLRCLEILMKSSRKPTKPSPAMRKSTSRPLAVSGLSVKRCAADVGAEGGGEDDRPSHGRGAALGVVRGRPVVADELAVAALARGT